MLASIGLKELEPSKSTSLVRYSCSATSLGCGAAEREIMLSFKAFASPSRPRTT